jgi:hypothetical protein
MQMQTEGGLMFVAHPVCVFTFELRHVAGDEESWITMCIYTVLKLLRTNATKITHKFFPNIQ